MTRSGFLQAAAIDVTDSEDVLVARIHESFTKFSTSENTAFFTSSTDASNWQFVGEKKPISANSSERRTYSLLDENPGRGIVYYRLTEHDLSGKKTIAPIRFVRISDEQLVNTVIFPNPNDGKMVNIQSPVFKEGEVEVSIISTDGKMFYKQTVKSNSTDMFTLSNLNLPSATYFINLKTNNQAQSLKLQVLNEE